jgi:hypothetical protein
MPRLSIALAAASLTISLAPAANAYGTEPTFTIMDAAITMPAADEVCIPSISEALAKALALPQTGSEARLAQLACATDE